MTKQCHHYFLVNQETAEKHVFRKSKKYRTLCSVALGTMVTAVVAWGGQVAQADEVATPSQDKTVQLTDNPATNLPEAQPTPVAEQTDSPANRQGRQVADVIAGLPAQNKGSIGTAIVRVFDMVAASTGLSERVARQTFDKVEVVHTSGNDHAGYYPGATTITLKLIFNPETGAIYGAQAVGQKGVDKRIDILATAIKAGLTIDDLPELEFTYAPPFGSAKDPVNMIGYAAMNLAQGLSHNVQWYDLSDELSKGKVLLDVRNPGELDAGRFPNAMAIPLDDLRDRLGELDKSQSYIVSCHSGLRPLPNGQTGGPDS